MTKKNTIFVKSMTGHGHNEVLCGNIKFLIDIFSTNHRQLDMAFDLPDDMMVLESNLRERIKRKIRRGSIFCKITASCHKDKFVLKERELSQLNLALKGLRHIAKALNLKDDITLSSFLIHIDRIKNGVSGRSLMPLDFARILDAFEQAVEKMISMRRKEGKALADDILKRLKQIEINIEKIKKILPQMAKQYRRKLISRLKEFTQEIAADDERILKEVAFMAERVDINEELVRLKSHIAQFKKVLFSDEPYGKKLDFLIQEMIRECSTIAAKANNKDISHLIVDSRADIERIREQVQNLE